MAKKILGQVKLQIAAGKATPAPPVGTALGPHGVNIMDFCKAFNAKTAGQEGLIIPGGGYRLSGPVVQLHHEDTAGCGASEAGREHREGVGRAESDQSRYCHSAAGRRDRQDQDARFECRHARDGVEDRCRDGAVDGD